MSDGNRFGFKVCSLAVGVFGSFVDGYVRYFGYLSRKVRGFCFRFWVSWVRVVWRIAGFLCLGRVTFIGYRKL